MSRFKYILAAGLLGLCLHSTAVAAKSYEVPKHDGDIDNVIWAANKILKSSLPACYTAHCIKIDCGWAGGLWEPLLITYQAVGGMGPALQNWLKLQVKASESHHADASRDRNTANRIRDAQLVQDSLSVVAVTASEIASILDFRRSFKENLSAWKDPAKADEQKSRWFEFFKHFKDVLSRIDAVTKAPDIGKNTKQKITDADFVKLAAEAHLRMQEAERTLKNEGGKSPKLSKAAISQLKDVLDLALKMDRIARQIQLTEVVKTSEMSSDLADKSNRIIRRLSERWRKSVIAKAALRNALNGLGVCYQRQCVNKAKSGQFRIEPHNIGKPNERAGTEVALGYYDKKLKIAQPELSAIASKYTVVADYSSKLSVVERRVPFTREVSARYRLQKFRRGSEVFSCVPEGSELKVYRRPYKFGNKAVMSLGVVNDYSGKRDFKVQQDISGTWKARKADLEVEIAVKDGAITLTRKNVPIDGRDRVYSGTLKRRLSEPGKYTILFEDSPGEIYLPADFDIAGQLPASEKNSRVISTPEHVKDISPKVPEDIRAKLIKEPHKQDSRYRANVAPHFDKEGKLKLKIEIYNYVITFKKTSRKIESVKEKLRFEHEFERAE